MNRKWAAIAIVVLVSIGIALPFSNLAISDGTAEFSTGTRPGLNTLTVRAPHGYYVVHFSVVPREGDAGKYRYAVGGKSMGQNPAGPFGESVIHSTDFPPAGKHELATETAVQVSGKLDRASTASVPADAAFMQKCGVYVYLTKDRSLYTRIDGLVEAWVPPGPTL